MDVLTNFNLHKNQLINAVLQNLATVPTDPVEGQLYYSTTDNKMYIYNGSSWLSGGSMSGDDIIGAINLSTLIIDIDNLPSTVQDAIDASHSHSNKAVLDNITAAFTAALLTKLNGIADGAQVNTVNSVAGKTGVISLVPSDAGLGNVTNDAQVKKTVSSINGNIPTWNGATGDSLNSGYGVESSLVGSASALATASAIKTYVDSLLAANDAMIFKGTIGTGGTITALPTTYSAGWTYKVITAGTYAGYICEVGDVIIAIVDRSGSGNVNADWIAMQTNTDGVIIGPVSSTDGYFPLFNGVTGKLLKNSTFSPASFALANHTHDGVTKYVEAIGGATSVVVTHNLNSRDLVCTIRETGSPYAIVIADVEFTTLNTVTVYFATAPTASKYTITLM